MGVWTPARTGPQQARLAATNSKLRDTRLGRPLTFDLLVSVLVFGAALALSITHPAAHAFMGESQNGDAAYWDLNAESWARGYATAKVPDIRTGYSVLLGMVYVLTGPDFWHAFAAQAVLFAAGAVAVYWLGKLIGGRLVGLLAAAQLSLSPYMWEWTAITTTELVGSVANLGALLFLVIAVGRGRRAWSAALFGVLLAIANVVRSLTLPFLVPALLLIAASPVPRSARVRRCVAAVVATLLILAPAAGYQQIVAGETGLSSNSAANLYGASSPKYGAWTPAMYDEVVAGLQARGITPTPQQLEAEFARLTVQNYLEYPEFQVRRIIEGAVRYATFEGETDRPADYAFLRRPIVGIFLVASTALGLLMRAFTMRRLGVAGIALAALLVGLVLRPIETLTLFLLAGILFTGAGVLRRPRSPAVLGALAVFAYWSLTGFLAIVTTNAAGFFLVRLYTQVEPERGLLIALGAVYIPLGLLAGWRARNSLADLLPFVRTTPRAPAYARTVLIAAGCCAAAIVSLGAVKLAAINIDPPAATPPFAVPTDADLAVLADRLGLPGPIQYVNSANFGPIQQRLTAPVLPTETQAYAIPGQYSRFLWYMPNQDRTVYWFVFSDAPRPASLDRTQLLVESLGRLGLNTYRDQLGLLIVVPTAAYFQLSADWAQFIPLTTRGFLPWDAAAERFRADQAVIFPLDVPLYDHQRFLAAVKEGTVNEVGSIAVASGDRTVPSYSLGPLGIADSPQRKASLGFQDVWIPPSAHAHFWLSLDPRVAAAGLAPQRVELRVGPDARDLLASVELDPHKAAPGFQLVDVDLSHYGGQRTTVTVQVVAPAEGPPAVVLVGDPRLIMPPVV